MKKIIIIIILVISLGLIGTGIFFSLTAKDGGFGNNASDEEVVNLDEEIAQNEDVHSENVHIYRTIEDATSFLKSIYETDNVVVSYNDGIIARIKVFAETDDELTYVYHINGGDLIIE